MAQQKREKIFSDELIDGLLSQRRKPEDINGLLKQFTKAVVERAMEAEMNEHLGYEKHDPSGANSGNSRNGFTRKTLTGEFGEVEIATPRDRNGSFEPQMVRNFPRSGERQAIASGQTESLIGVTVLVMGGV